MTATWSASFDPKCANRPLFESDISAARRPIDSPSTPAERARSVARSRMAALVASPLRMSIK